MEAQRSLGENGLLKKAIGCPFCDKTAPIPLPDASVSMVKGTSKSGRDNTGAVIRASFNLQKAFYVFVVHLNESIVVALMRGATIEAYPRANRR